VTRILLIGKNGQIGWELERTLAPVGEIIAVERATLDLASPDSISKTVRAIRPDVIVNAAAYTAVDRAESEPKLAMLVNGIAPGILAEEARLLGALIIHFSTDYVFSGEKNAPYLEDDATAPLNVYGSTKLAGEHAIQAVGVRHYIFRTSWVYASRGHNFLRTILRLAHERSELKIVEDQIGAPTWARAIADAVARVLLAGNGGADAGQARDVSLYHITASGAVSWFGFAQAILEIMKAMLPELNVPRLIPIASGDYPSPARRPANSRLDNSRLTATFGIVSAPWDVMLRQCMGELATERHDLIKAATLV
jgi:dTDP-4-dehydrorhamnose reductase